MTATIPHHHRPIVPGLNLLLAGSALVVATIALVRADDGAGTEPASPPAPVVVMDPAAAASPAPAPMQFIGCGGRLGVNRC